MQRENDPKRVRAYRIAEPPTLDGLVTEEMWQRLVPAAQFTQQNPVEGDPASEATEVRVAFDDKNLYFGIICFDSEPENIVVTQNRRDAELEDTDSIQILLDTFNDDQNGFIFGTSPAGIEFDAQARKQSAARGRWRTRAGWRREQRRATWRCIGIQSELGCRLGGPLADH